MGWGFGHFVPLKGIYRVEGSGRLRFRVWALGFRASGGVCLGTKKRTGRRVYIYIYIYTHSNRASEGERERERESDTTSTFLVG